MPQMMDPNFVQTVILLCQHDDSGAFGLVLNRPATTNGRVTVNLHPPLSIDHELQIWMGGPVEPERSWILVRAGDGETAPEDSVKIGDGMYLSTSPMLLRRVLEPDPPESLRLIVGYAGWGAGQLEHELQESAWLLSDAPASLIFDTPADQMWEAAIRRLGADPAALQGSRGVH
jgi:putative transcriptional regulator